MFKALASASLLLVAVGSALTPSPAIAHTDLVESTPADGARLTSTPTQVSLEFNEAVSVRLATVTVQVAGEDLGDLTVEQGNTTSEVTASLADDATRGLLNATDDPTWTVSYRVTSADGHPIEGRLRFTAPLSPGDNAPSAPSSSRSDSAVPPPNDDLSNDSNQTAATVVIGGLAAAGAAVGCVLLVRARRRANES